MSANVTVISENNKTIAESRLISITNIQPSSTGGSSETPTSIKTKYESNADTNAFTDAEQTKLAGIETGADITDATNVNSAGAVMESDFSTAHTILVQQAGTGTPELLNVPSSTFVGNNGSGGDIVAMTAAQARSVLNVEDGAQANVTTFLDVDFAITDNTSGYQQSFVADSLTSNRAITLPDFDLNLNYVNLGNDGSVLIGENAGGSLPTWGVESVIVGVDAGASLNSNQWSNTIIGYSGALEATEIADNIIIGAWTAQNATSAWNNIIIGYGAANGLTSSGYNIFIGDGTGFTSNAGASASYNVVIGQNVRIPNTASNHIVMGYGSDYSYYDNHTDVTIKRPLITRDPTFQDSLDNTKTLNWDLSSISTLSSRTITAPDFGLNLNFVKPSLGSSVYFGDGGTGSSDDGSNNANTGIGFNTLSSTGVVNVGVNNTAVGAYVMPYATGSSNTCVGTYAGFSLSIGAYNTFIGGGAGQSVTGNRNCLIGYRNQRSPSLGNGSYNTIIGGYEYGLVSGTSNHVVLVDGQNNESYKDDGTQTTIRNPLTYTKYKALSADPPDPADGDCVTWISDGTDSGDAGDFMIKINVGGTVKIGTLADYSTL